MLTKAVYDTETDGFLSRMTRIHCLVIRDVTSPNFDERTTHVFRRHDGYELVVNEETGETRAVPPEDNIEEGVRMLEQFDIRIAHNGIDFDEKAIRKIYPWYAPKGVMMDTLVLARLIVPDTKQLDNRLWAQKKFPGYLIGKHSLDAWGYRLGKHKGDYSKECAKAGVDPWAKWNQPMEDYCVNDVAVNEVLWAAIEKDMPDDRAVQLEHSVHDLASVMRTNGVPFDLAAAQTLRDKLQAELAELTETVVAKYGSWYAPERKKIIAPIWDDPEAIKPVTAFETPDDEWGEDTTRSWWGRMEFPKITRRSRARIAKWQKENEKRALKELDPLPYPATADLPDVTEGCPFVRVKEKLFNPGSRPHVVDRFVTVHGWTPTDFTEKGTPEINDAVLTKVRDQIPEAAPVAEIFFLKKLLGQLSEGRESWINNCEEDGRVHGYINTNGAVTGRCTHNSPNMSQVPSVIKKGKTILKGREGEYGWECRSLFHSPPPFLQVGADLANIEARAFAAVLSKFDGGKLAAELTAGLDLHDLNMAATGIDDRGIMKRVFFGLLYGAGDLKLGLTADPTLDEAAARKLGGHYRSLIVNKIPGFKQADAMIKQQAGRGYLIGLDGRRLECRSEHSALNLRLQSDAALIAKKWLITTEDDALAEGLDHGWEGDFVMMGFYHDEQQSAVMEDVAQLFAKIAVNAAPKAGEYFEFGCAVQAEAKIGHNWAECH